jgi:hypothetical protein
MILKTVLTAVICGVLLVWSNLSKADEYRPNEFLSLDLSKAVLSPKPLGPRSEFAPVAIEARTDPRTDPRTDAGSDGAGAQAGVEPRANSRIAVSRKLKATVPNVAVAQMRPGKPRGAVRAKLARHGNPLDAQASDTRIQVWPCNSGGICNWQRQND